MEVAVESYKESDQLIRITALIFVSRESQKAILLGHQGKAIKKTATDARKDIERLTELMSVLADEKRLLILYALSHQRMCVCMLADLTQSPYSKCSYHITRLKDKGIIEAQNQGNYIIYSLTPYGKNILNTWQI